MKVIFGYTICILFFLAFSLQFSLSSCTKEVTKTDTVTVTKHDTTILIHKDTIAVTAKDTVFPMDVAAWNFYSTSSNSYLSPSSTTYMNTSEGIKFFAQAYRSGVRLETKTEVGFKNKTIYYKWKVNGNGQFAGYVIQVKYDPVSADGTSPAIQGVDFSNFCITSPFTGFTLIQPDTWYYSRVKAIAGTDNYEAITATGNYDNKGGSVILDQTIPVYTKNGYIVIRIGDNYSTSAYAVLGECYIASN